MMNAFVLEEVDGQFNFQQLPVPEILEHQVMVEIHASGLNPLDTKIRAGKAGHAKQPLPAVLGMDLAGKVLAVGAAVDRFKVGDEVFGLTGGVGGVQGSLAAFAVVDADLLALKPKNMTMSDAAAIPLIFITAWEGVVDRGAVQAGDQVLIHGGAGGVGHMAVQIAKAFGAEVYATVQQKDHELISSYGAVPIDHTQLSVAEYVAKYTNREGFDLVYDTVGGAVLDASFQAVKTYTGHVVSCLGWGTHALAPLSFKGATYSGVFTLIPLLTGKGKKHHGEIMTEAAKLIAAGKLTVLKDAVHYKPTELHEAFKALETGINKGKVVITLK